MCVFNKVSLNACLFQTYSPLFYVMFTFKMLVFIRTLFLWFIEENIIKIKGVHMIFQLFIVSY